MPSFNKFRNENMKSSIGKALENAKTSTRAEEIARTNARSKLNGVKLHARERHARRHLGKKGTSLVERRKFTSEMTKGEN